MESLTISEILKATKGKLIQGNKNYFVRNITIDTRKLMPGDMFIAIKGKLLDGHTYIAESLRKGADGIITQDRRFEFKNWETTNVIQVANTTKALGDIARYYRKKYSPTVIAITGSNGKTTTKEMTAQILKTKFNIVSAPASFNNDIGVPLTVLQLTKDTEVLILEMEMNELGGTKRLCNIARPNIGAITNIGDTHLEFMYSRQGVAQEKSELLEFISGSGIAILNADDSMIMEMWQRYNFKGYFTFGIEKSADIFANKIINHFDQGTEFRLCNKYITRLKVPGVFNIYNALAAASITKALGCEFENIVLALEEYTAAPMRMERVEINGITIFNDAFNANPQSMLAALETFANFTASGRKIVVLGDMLELGIKSAEFHRDLGKNLPKSIDILVTVGEQAKHIAEGSNEAEKKPEEVIICNDYLKASNKLVDIIKKGDKILIKGSRLMKLEEIINKLKQQHMDADEPSTF